MRWQYQPPTAAVEATCESHATWDKHPIFSIHLFSCHFHFSYSFQSEFCKVSLLLDLGVCALLHWYRYGLNFSLSFTLCIYMWNAHAIMYISFCFSKYIYIYISSIGFLVYTLVYHLLLAAVKRSCLPKSSRDVMAKLNWRSLLIFY